MRKPSTARGLSTPRIRVHCWKNGSRTNESALPAPVMRAQKLTRLGTAAGDNCTDKSREFPLASESRHSITLRWFSRDRDDALKIRHAVRRSDARDEGGRGKTMYVCICDVKYFHALTTDENNYAYRRAPTNVTVKRATRNAISLYCKKFLKIQSVQFKTNLP